MATPTGRSSPGEVGRLFLRLGLTAFGGPAAHIGLMEREVVERRPGRRGLRQRLQQSAAKLLKRVPGFAAEKPDLGAFSCYSMADAAQKVVKAVAK